MSFALARQKGSVTRWDDFRSQRNKRQKRGNILSKNLSSKPKFGVWIRTLAELTSKLFLAGVFEQISYIRIHNSFITINIKGLPKKNHPGFP